MGRMEFPSGTVGPLPFTDIEEQHPSVGGRPRGHVRRGTPALTALFREQIQVAGGHVLKTVDQSDSVRCSPTRPPRWGRRWLSSGLSILAGHGRPARRSGCGWRCILGTCMERQGDYFGPVVNRSPACWRSGHEWCAGSGAAGVTYELLAGRLPGGIGLRHLGEHQLKEP